jgi:hypothetical protein
MVGFIVAAITVALAALGIGLLLLDHRASSFHYRTASRSILRRDSIPMRCTACRGQSPGKLDASSSQSLAGNVRSVPCRGEGNPR